MNYVVDINCDVGEDTGNDAGLMPYISSCSIACGAHAGNEKMIIDTIKLAMLHGVHIGAHPSFPDKENFGREVMDISSANLQRSIENQINVIKDKLQQLNGKLNHVKAHGALYNLSGVDAKIAQVLMNAFQNTTEGVFLYVPYNSILQKLAIKNKVKIKVEAFADRNYNSDLTLVSRKRSNALITDEEILSQHLLKMIVEKKVISVDGVEVEIAADTFCIHGDNPNAKNILKFLHKKLLKNGIKIV